MVPQRKYTTSIQVEYLSQFTFFGVRSQATPEEFAGMPALREVTLASNRLAEVGPILDVLHHLVKLDISSNELTNIGSLATPRRQVSSTATDL